MGFFSRLKKEVWKVVRAILVMGVIVTIVITVITYGKRIKRPDTVEMILDSDTGKEMEDLFAVTLALIDPKIELIGLTSEQWNLHPGSRSDSSVYISQDFHEKLLALHGQLDVPHLLGEQKQTGRYGDPKAPLSPAVNFIIEEAQKQKQGSKLNVITLGSVTNLARAIENDSTIIPKIRWYGICMKYNERDHIWNKNEFNARNDLDGLDYILNVEGLETHIMPVTTGDAFTFTQTETFDLMRNRGPKWAFLVNRWQEMFFENKLWHMGDISLLQAIMNPDLATEKSVFTPTENLRKRIDVYTWIDETKMKREYRKLVRKAMQDISSDIR